MAIRNVHKEEAIIFKLPVEAIAEDRGQSYCETPQLVVASLSDASYYKNDRTALAYKFDAMTVELEDASGNAYPAPGVEVAFPYQSDAVGFVIDWRQVAESGALIQGCWRVKVNWEIEGVTGWFYYGSYELREYSPFNVRGTVRLFVVLNDMVRKQGINYKDSGFAGTVRFKGFFGDMQPNYDTENITYTDRTQEKVRNEALRTYELRSNYLLNCMTRLIDEEHLLAANQIYISDHNASNHVQNYFDFPVILSQEESPKFDYTGTVYARITALFNDKVQVSESKYDGNIKGSSNIILSLPTVVSTGEVCAGASYDVQNSSGTSLASGTIASGGSAVIPIADISFTDSDGTTSSVPSGVDIVATACGVALDSDAQAFLEATGIVDSVITEAINSFVVDAKAQGLWAELDKVYPLVGGLSTLHVYNLKNATPEGAFYGGVTHNSNGVGFNGTTGYFDTGWSATVGNVYNRHFSQYIYSQTTSGSWSGVFDGSSLFGMRLDLARSLSYMGFNNLESTTLVNLVPASVYCVTVDSSTVAKMYNNGVLVKTNATTVNAAPTSGTVYVGALNSSGTPAFYQNSQVRFITCGNKLDATQQFNLNHLVRLFNAKLSR